MTAASRAFEYDPFSQVAMTDPHPLYRMLRDEHPVYYVAKYDMFAVSRFEDVRSVLSDSSGALLSTEGSLPTPERLSRHNTGPLPDPPVEPLGIHTTYSPAVHLPLRQAHGRALRPKEVATLETDIRSLARLRLDDVVPAGEFDVVLDYAGIVAAQVVCQLFQLPSDLAKEVLQCVNAVTRTDPQTGGFSMADALAKVTSLIRPSIERRRADESGERFPLVDGLLEHRLAGRALTVDDIATVLVGIVIGATETLPKVFGHGLMELADAPEQLAAVRADPSVRCAPAFEEMLRFCGPAQWFMRTARLPFDVAGQVVRPGQRVLSLIQAANRDEREFEDPDEFRWNRRIARTLAFGAGPHFCIGAHLARLEGRVLLEEWMQRVRRYEVLTERLVRHPSSFQLGWNSVPVRVETR